jgi:NACalpha-BTF3-like transcription factor
MPDEFPTDDPENYESDLIALTDDEMHEQAEKAALEAEAREQYAAEQAAEDDEPESAPENPEDAASEPDSEPVDDQAGNDLEAVREALSESDRNAFDNYTHLAENAPSDSAREFWQGMADEVATKAA